jgi:hypothetical protein
VLTIPNVKIQENNLVIDAVKPEVIKFYVVMKSLASLKTVAVQFEVKV